MPYRVLIVGAAKKGCFGHPEYVFLVEIKGRKSLEITMTSMDIVNSLSTDDNMKAISDKIIEAIVKELPPMDRKVRIQNFQKEIYERLQKRHPNKT